MRGKKTKRIRKQVYGDMSIREDRLYARHKKDGHTILMPDSLRVLYQRAKKEEGENGR